MEKNQKQNSRDRKPEVRPLSESSSLDELGQDKADYVESKNRLNDLFEAYLTLEDYHARIRIFTRSLEATRDLPEMAQAFVRKYDAIRKEAVFDDVLRKASHALKDIQTCLSKSPSVQNYRFLKDTHTKWQTQHGHVCHV